MAAQRLLSRLKSMPELKDVTESQLAEYIISLIQSTLELFYRMQVFRRHEYRLEQTPLARSQQFH